MDCAPCGERYAQDINSVLAIVPGGAEAFVAHRITRVIVNDSVGPLGAVLAFLLAIYSARAVRVRSCGLR